MRLFVLALGFTFGFMSKVNAAEMEFEDNLHPLSATFNLVEGTSPHNESLSRSGFGISTSLAYLSYLFGYPDDRDKEIGFSLSLAKPMKRSEYVLTSLYFVEGRYPWFSDNKRRFESYSIDFRYSSFSRDTLGGFYWSALTRLGYQTGREQSVTIDNTVVLGDVKSHFRIGLGLGVGYRFLVSEHWYISSGLHFGRYLFADRHFERSDPIAPTNTIFYLELLELGYRF